MIKTSRPGQPQPILLVPFFRQNPELCVASTLIKYIELTKNLRGSTNNLFILLKNSHKAITSQTLSRWIKKTLTDSGIDTNVFASHSTRHTTKNYEIENNRYLKLQFRYMSKFVSM